VDDTIVVPSLLLADSKRWQWSSIAKGNPLLKRSTRAVSAAQDIHVGAAEGCDLLILPFKSQIKRSQPAAAPTGGG
jgi:hypothetical protein